MGATNINQQAWEIAYELDACDFVVPHGDINQNRAHMAIMLLDYGNHPES
jgi:hypothetical protein